MMAGITPVKNHPNFGTLASVKKETPSLAKPRSSLQSVEMNVKISLIEEWLVFYFVLGIWIGGLLAGLSSQDK